LKLSFEIRKVIAEKIGMQERKGYFLLEKMIKKFGLKVEFIEALKLTNEKNAKDLLLKNIYQNNKGSLLRTVVYTIGHFAIAITVLMIVADVSFKIALTDAIVEPIANSIWYFILDKWWTSKSKK